MLHDPFAFDYTELLNFIKSSEFPTSIRKGDQSTLVNTQLSEHRFVAVSKGFFGQTKSWDIPPYFQSRIEFSPKDDWEVSECLVRLCLEISSEGKWLKVYFPSLSEAEMMRSYLLLRRPSVAAWTDLRVKAIARQWKMALFTRFFERAMVVQETARSSYRFNRRMSGYQEVESVPNSASDYACFEAFLFCIVTAKGRPYNSLTPRLRVMKSQTEAALRDSKSMVCSVAGLSAFDRQTRWPLIAFSKESGLEARRAAGLHFFRAPNDEVLGSCQVLIELFDGQAFLDKKRLTLSELRRIQSIFGFVCVSFDICFLLFEFREVVPDSVKYFFREEASSNEIAFDERQIDQRLKDPARFASHSLRFKGLFCDKEFASLIFHLEMRPDIPVLFPQPVTTTKVFKACKKTLKRIFFAFDLVEVGSQQARPWTVVIEPLQMTLESAFTAIRMKNKYKYGLKVFYPSSSTPNILDIVVPRLCLPYFKAIKGIQAIYFKRMCFFLAKKKPALDHFSNCGCLLPLTLAGIFVGGFIPIFESQQSVYFTLLLSKRLQQTVLVSVFSLFFCLFGLAISQVVGASVLPSTQEELFFFFKYFLSNTFDNFDQVKLKTLSQEILTDLPTKPQELSEKPIPPSSSSLSKISEPLIFNLSFSVKQSIFFSMENFFLQYSFDNKLYVQITSLPFPLELPETASVIFISISKKSKSDPLLKLSELTIPLAFLKLNKKTSFEVNLLESRLVFKVYVTVPQFSENRITNFQKTSTRYEHLTGLVSPVSMDQLFINQLTISKPHFVLSDNYFTVRADPSRQLISVFEKCENFEEFLQLFWQFLKEEGMINSSIQDSIFAEILKLLLKYLGIDFSASFIRLLIFSSRLISPVDLLESYIIMNNEEVINLCRGMSNVLVVASLLLDELKIPLVNNEGKLVILSFLLSSEEKKKLQQKNRLLIQNSVDPKNSIAIDFDKNLVVTEKKSKMWFRFRIDKPVLFQEDFKTSFMVFEKIFQILLLRKTS